jgi:hypothetical protein
LPLAGRKVNDRRAAGNRQEWTTNSHSGSGPGVSKAPSAARADRPSATAIPPRVHADGNGTSCANACLSAKPFPQCRLLTVRDRAVPFDRMRE